MNRIAWPQLMRLGLAGLGLTPETFWQLTPVELMLMAGGGDGPPVPTRKTFEELASRFPDAANAACDVEQQ
ncbi:rcc01693 family protein [Amaricoccus tamworthensis]|uniref:rcc01693 family protein n=1 Tax=Amaricoccus tamworthensis TaxID=57002 RepID=UPI003C7B880A